MFDFSPYIRFISKTTYFINQTVVARDCRILYIISGCGSFECEGEMVSLFPNTLVYYPYGKQYKISSKEGMLFYTINFDFTQDYKDFKVMVPLPANENGSSESLRSIPDELQPLFDKVLNFENAFWAEKDICDIYTETLTQNRGYTEICNALLKIVLINIYRRKVSHRIVNPLCEKMKELICQEPKYNGKELARILNYHPFYLNEVFKKNEGCTLHSFIMQQRLKKANELVMTTQIPLNEIALMCGFSSQAHFSEAFKKMYQVTPGHLRRCT